MVLQIPGLLIEGKEVLRDQFVRPFIPAFRGNRHLVKKMIFGPGAVVVEFSFEAEHKGPFGGYVATGARVNLPGCGVYEYDSAKRQITAGRIYFDVGRYCRRSRIRWQMIAKRLQRVCSRTSAI